MSGGLGSRHDVTESLKKHSTTIAAVALVTIAIAIVISISKSDGDGSDIDAKLKSMASQPGSTMSKGQGKPWFVTLSIITPLATLCSLLQKNSIRFGRCCEHRLKPNRRRVSFFRDWFCDDFIDGLCIVVDLQASIKDLKQQYTETLRQFEQLRLSHQRLKTETVFLILCLTFSRSDK